DHRHVPLAELEADVAFDERKRVVLTDREHDGVARDDLAADDRLLEPLLGFDRLELLELHSRQRAVLDDEADRLQIFEALDLLLFGVLELPRRRLEVLPRLAGDDLHAVGAEALRRSAAVHRGVADTDNQYTLADRIDVPEVDRLEPFDADE